MPTPVLPIYFRTKGGVLPTPENLILGISVMCGKNEGDFMHKDTTGNKLGSKANGPMKVMSRQHPAVGMSLKIYLSHIKVTSCAMTGFVCTKSCS